MANWLSGKIIKLHKLIMLYIYIKTNIMYVDTQTCHWRILWAVLAIWF